MDVTDQLSRLLNSLKENKQPRDDSLIARLLTLLTEYIRDHGFGITLKCEESFTSEDWLGAGPTALNFVVQLAGICGSLYDEKCHKFSRVEALLSKVMKSNLFDSVSCSWLKATESVISKHKKKPLSDDKIFTVSECLKDKKGYYAGEAAVTLVERLIDNGLSGEECMEVHRGGIESILSSLVAVFKKERPSNAMIMLRAMSLAEKIFKPENDEKIPDSWKLILLDGMVQPLLALIKKRALIDVNRVLDLFVSMMKAQKKIKDQNKQKENEEQAKEENKETKKDKEENKEQAKEENKEQAKEENKEQAMEENKEQAKEENREQAMEENKETKKGDKEENKEQAKEENKEQAKEENKEQAKEENKEQAKEENKEQAKEENKEQAMEENKEQAMEENKEEAKEGKEENREEDKEENKEADDSSDLYNVVFELLIDLLSNNEAKARAIQVASWMLKEPCFRRLKEALEHLCMIPLLRDLGKRDPNLVGKIRFQFADVTFDANTLCETFKAISIHDFAGPKNVAELCMGFLNANAVETKIGSKRPSKCIKACLDALHCLHTRDDQSLTWEQKTTLLLVLQKCQYDATVGTKALDLITDVAKLCHDDEEESPGFPFALHSLLHFMKENNLWMIREGAVVMIGTLFAVNVTTLEEYKRMIDHKLHMIIWEALDDEDEPYVRASATKALLELMLCSHRLRTGSDISTSQAMDKMMTMAKKDQEAFARRAACSSIAGYVTAHAWELFPCLLPKGTTPRNLTRDTAKVFKTLGRAVEKDMDWEVKIVALKFFQGILCDSLFKHLVDHHLNALKGDGAGQPVLGKDELEMVSLAFTKVVRALDDFESPVVEAARAALVKLRTKFEERAKGGDAKPPKDLFFQRFVSSFLAGGKEFDARKMNEVKEDYGAQEKLAKEIMSLLVDIDACLESGGREKQEFWTSDEEEYLDHGKADCY